METRHIRLDYEEALSAKKQLLSCELNLLETLKKIQNFKVLRKKEISTKSKLKIELNSLMKKLNSINLTFPKEEIPVKKIKKKEKEVSPGIQKELEEIKRKLEKLSE